MITNTDHDDGDGDPVNGDSGEAQGPRVTRRQLLQGTAVAGAAAALGVRPAAAETNTTTTTTTSDGDSTPESQEIVTNDNHDTAITKETRIATGNAMLYTPLNHIIAEGTDNLITATNQWLFGSTSTQDSNLDAHNAALAQLGNAGIALRDALATWSQNGFKELETLAYRVMEQEVAAAINAGDTAATAKTRAKERIRDEVLITPEKNLVKLAEGIGIRVAGVFWVWNNSLNDNGYIADSDGDGTWSPVTDSYWKFDADGADYSWLPKTEDDATQWKYGYVSGFNISAQTLEYELMNGDTMQVRGNQLVTFEDVGSKNPTSTLTLFPIDASGRVSPKPRKTIANVNDSYRISALENVAFFHAREGTNRYVAEYISQGQIQSLYNDLYSLRDTLYNEVDQYVDTMYSQYDPGDVVDPGDLSIPTLLAQSGQTWVQSGDSGFAEILASLSGYATPEGGQAMTIETLDGSGNVVDTYTGLPVPTVSKSNLPAVQYQSSDYVVDKDAGTLTVSHSSMPRGTHEYTWTDGSGTQHTVTFAKSDMQAVDSTTTTTTSDSTTTSTTTESGTDEFVYEFTSGDDAPTGSSTIQSQSLQTSEATGVREGQQTSITAYVAVQSGENGQLVTIDPANTSGVAGWRVQDVQDQWFVTFDEPAPDTPQIDNTELQNLWDKYAELQKKYENLKEENSGGGGGAGGAGNKILGLPKWAAYAGGGAVATVLAAIGLGGDS